jgi:hypothetical protein
MLAEANPTIAFNDIVKAQLAEANVRMVQPLAAWSRANHSDYLLKLTCPFHDEIPDFFRCYVKAFAREDADTLSELWDEVGLFPTPTGNFAMSRSSFRDHCATLFGFYRAQGVVRPQGTLMFADELFPGVAQARMAYRMIGVDDTPVAEWEHVYVLRRTDTWRVSLTIADGEMAAWTAKGVKLWSNLPFDNHQITSFAVAKVTTYARSIF